MSSTRQLRSGRSVVSNAETSKSKSKPKLKMNEKEKKAQPLPPLNDLDVAIANLKKSQEQCNKLSITEIKKLQKELKTVFDNTKRRTQLFEQEKSAVKPSRNRSGKKRGAGASVVINNQKSVYTEGKWIIKGMDDVGDKFAEDEQEYLKKAVSKIKVVAELKFEHLKYLVVYVFLDELSAIKRNELKSIFHDRYHELEGKCQHDLQSEVKTTLFTNEQRDYINGMLQELFDANKKNESGDIRHMEINYVVNVMLAEATIRIVKYIHKFDTIEETIAFMKKSSREAHGISDDEEDY